MLDGSVVDTSGKKIGVASTPNQVAFDENGKVLGVVMPNGNVVDKNGAVIGKQMLDGSVVDASGNKIGVASTPSQVAFDEDGKPLGVIMPNGNVVDKNGAVIGKKLSDGSVVDTSGKKIGVASVASQVALGENGKLLGVVMPDGSVVDKDGAVIGKKLSDGSVVDTSGKKIGVASAPSQVAFDKNGKLLSVVMSNGNVVDKNGAVIGRVKEKGGLIDLLGDTKGSDFVYGPDGKVLGRVDKNGNVYDENGNLIGRVNENGDFVDVNGNVYDKEGNLIGRLNESGEIVDANGNIVKRSVSLFDRSDIVTRVDPVSYDDEEEESDDDSVSKIMNLIEADKYHKSLGIALTPDGEYLGEILEDNTVIDEEGDVIGYRTGDGLIVDEDGELIGLEEVEYDETVKSSPFIPAGSFGPGGAYGIGAGNSGNLGPGGGYGPGERYDPARQAALNAAMQNRRTNISVGKISSNYNPSNFDGYQKDWAEQGIGKSISSWRVDMSEMIFSDKPIPAVIARAIDTNNPAPITAYVERNVYAEEGRNIIIPAGSRVIGSFGSITASTEATSESARVQITWERLIRPDGSIFVFSGQTADAQGRAGALGYVDQQLFKKYTLPVVTTVLTSAASFFIASAEDNAGEVENSKQQAASDARQNFLTDMESLFDDILADKTDVKAMTYVPAGTRIIIYPNTDLWLNSDERSEEAANAKRLEKPAVFIDDAKVAAEVDAKERKKVAEAASGSVVYNADDAGVDEAKPTPFIEDKSSSNKPSGQIAPPPPPPSSGTISAPQPSTNSTTSTNDGIPALF